jgi:hypothetical protein
VRVIYSQRDATFIGAELPAEQDIGRIWQEVWGIDGRYDFVRATFSDGTFVPKMPPPWLGAGIYYRDTNWFARLNLLHAFAQNEFAAFDTPTPGGDAAPSGAGCAFGSIERTTIAHRQNSIAINTEKICPGLASNRASSPRFSQRWLRSDRGAHSNRAPVIRD